MHNWKFKSKSPSITLNLYENFKAIVALPFPSFHDRYLLYPSRWCPLYLLTCFEEEELGTCTRSLPPVVAEISAALGKSATKAATLNFRLQPMQFITLIFPKMFLSFQSMS